MNRNLIAFLIKMSALSALVFAFMSKFLNMRVPGLAQICLGVMFLCYAMDFFIQYKYTKNNVTLLGILLFIVAFAALSAVGIADIIK